LAFKGLKTLSFA